MIGAIQTAQFFGSSPNSGERSPDLEEEALVITEAVSQTFDNFDFVLDTLEHAGVQRIAAVRQQPRQMGVQFPCKGLQRFDAAAHRATVPAIPEHRA